MDHIHLAVLFAYNIKH